MAFAETRGKPSMVPTTVENMTASAAIEITTCAHCPIDCVNRLIS